MSDADDKDQHSVVSDINYNAVRADTVFPVAAKFRTVKRFANFTRIFELRNSAIQKVQDSSSF
jgi:hypothetical protein